MENIYYLSRPEIIIFLPKMEFHQQDIRHFLQENIPSRFKSLSPPEFEQFIRYLLEVDGYELLPIVETGDLSHLILASKEDDKLIVRGLRLDQDQLADEEEIILALKAKSFYETDQSWIITTSGYTDEARKLAEEADIEIWDWDALYNALCQLFFEGKNHLEYKDTYLKHQTAKEEIAELKLKAKWQAAEGIEPEWFNLSITVSNPTERNIYLHLELPALIDRKKNQIMADEWVEGDFVAGMIYAGASIRTNALFSVAKIGDRPPGGSIVLTCHERREVPLTYHLQARLQGEACFVVTYCYTRNSPEYHLMIAYRDEVLAASLTGRALISIYYFISPMMVRMAIQNKWVDRVIRLLMQKLMPLFRRRMQQKNFTTY
jgi:hypothetical protein